MKLYLLNTGQEVLVTTKPRKGIRIRKEEIKLLADNMIVENPQEPTKQLLELQMTLTRS